MSLPAGFTLALLVLGGASRSAPDQEGARPRIAPTKSADEVVASVRTILLAVREDEPGACAIQTQRLVDLGSAAVPALLEALESGLVPAALPATTESEGPEIMDETREAAAIHALAQRGRRELLPAAGALLERSTSAHTAAVAVRLLGAVGDRRELPRLCRTVRPKPDEIVDGERTDAFEAAATEILKRDSAAATTAHDLLRAEPDSVRWSLIRALAHAASESALVVLTTELGAHPEDDAFVLEQLTCASVSSPAPMPESIVLPVRPYLQDARSACVQKAAGCLAAMGDAESVEELIELLRSADVEVAHAAHAALVSLTNVGLMPDADRWGSWYAEESAWFRDEFPGLSRDLRSASAVAAVQAISGMAAHSLYRWEIADLLSAALEDRPAAIRTLACSALRQLGARTALPFLNRCAEDPDPRLAQEARRTLASLAPARSPAAVPPPSGDDAQADPGSSR